MSWILLIIEHLLHSVLSIKLGVIFQEVFKKTLYVHGAYARKGI